MITPKGIEMRITGSIVTLAMNQHCSTNSRKGNPLRIASAPSIDIDVTPPSCSKLLLMLGTALSRSWS